MTATKQQQIHLNNEPRMRVEIKAEEVSGKRQQPGMVSLWKQVVANAFLINIQLSYFNPSSLQLEQFHIEYKCGVWGDDTRVACCSISHIWCAGDFSPLAEAHLKQRKQKETTVNIWIMCFLQKTNAEQAQNRDIDINYCSLGLVQDFSNDLTAPDKFVSCESVHFRSLTEMCFQLL